ncbi:MAG: energy-coupling factor transporter ATPase [Lachnospiraceae bacterium]|nr:energy-coupling factor transporter ATPase [Lachnospiraceae bacterium]
MALIVDHLTHEYDEGGITVRALNDVSFSIHEGEFLGLIGHTGSGKSTLVQHLNGLLKPTSGNIYFYGKDIHDPEFDRRALRGKVGLVFQYPEHQLFEVTVFKDVCYGPRNLGLDENEVELRAYEALKQVGLGDENFYVSPFELSGGQKRRVAIAGVLAMKPEILILDEPTAGLDPKGREEILDLVVSIQEQTGMAIVLVSHSMDDVARYADRILVMDHGTVAFHDTPEKVFEHGEELEKMGLGLPQVTYLMRELAKETGLSVNTSAITIDQARDDLIRIAEAMRS